MSEARQDILCIMASKSSTFFEPKGDFAEGPGTDARQSASRQEPCLRSAVQSSSCPHDDPGASNGVGYGSSTIVSIFQRNLDFSKDSWL